MAVRDDVEGPQGPEKKSAGGVGAAGPEIQLQQGLPNAGSEAVPEKEFTLTFKESELNLILRGLGDLPARMTFLLLNKIFSSIEEQKVVEQP
jgi:hypothetical protein